MILAAAALATTYAPQQVGTTIAASEPVGHVRAGLLCLPKGMLRWRDVGIAERLDQRQIVGDALDGAGLSVAEFSRGGGRRVRGTVTRAGFDLCAREWGLGGGADRLSGKAALEVSWRVEATEGGGGDLTHVSRVERTIARDGAESVAAIYRDLLGDAARELAAWLKAGAGGSGTP